MDIKIFNFKSDPPLTPFAPEWDYSIGLSNISPLINCKKIAKIILEKEKNIISKYPVVQSSSIDGYTNLGPHSLTSRYSYYNLVDWPEKEIQKLKPIIKDFHDEFLKTLNLKIPSSITIKSWANVMRTGEKITPHIHTVKPHAYLSGHLNIQSDKTATLYINAVNQLNEPEVQEIKNVPGEITIFPMCLPHYTNKHVGSKERITIAFDISLKT